MNAGQKAAVAGLSATLAALALAAPRIAEREGWVPAGYVDTVGVKTRCLGSTKGPIVVGKTYTNRECMDQYAADLLSHGLEVSACLPAGLPPKVHAAFIQNGFNIGPPNFCKSSMSRKAFAGDLKGACEAIKLYVWAQGKDCRIKANKCLGVVNSRADEYAYCIEGLS